MRECDTIMKQSKRRGRRRGDKVNDREGEGERGWREKRERERWREGGRVR